MRTKSASKVSLLTISYFIIALLTLGVLSTSVGLAKPPAQDGPGEIAVPIFDGADYNTWLIDASNGWTTLILNQIRQPAFSAGGQWLIANGTRPDYEHLLLLKADDSEVEEISQYSEDAQSSWSPDGRSVVFSSTRESDRQYRLYVIDDVWEIEVKERVLTYGEGTSSVMGWHPLWLPDGRIVYNGCNAWEDGSKCGLTIIEPEGSIPVQITDQRHDLPLDARGDVILMMSYRDEDWEIYTIRTDGTDPRRLTSREGEDGLPTFSPDGQSIAFVRDESGEDDKDKEVWALWVMNADGTNPRKLLDLGAVFGRDELDWTQEQLSWRPSLPTTPVVAAGSPMPPSDVSSWKLFLEDDFSDPNSGWVTDESEIRRVGYEEGQYSILIKEKRWVAWDLLGVGDFTDFILEVEATQVAGPNNNEYGVICRHQDNDNFYFFAISGLGHYSVQKLENDAWAMLVRWKKSRDILQGQNTNRLRVIGNGPQMSFYVNDQHLVDVYDASFPEGDLGLAAGAFDEPGVHIRFDNLRVLLP